MDLVLVVLFQDFIKLLNLSVLRENLKSSAVSKAQPPRVYYSCTKAGLKVMFCQ